MTETLATATTGFGIGKRTGSQQDVVPVQQHLTTTEPVGMRGDRDRAMRDREDARGSIDPRDVFSRDLICRAGPSASWFTTAIATIA